MNEKVLKILEFNKILASLSDRATSAPGKSLCTALAPMDELYDIEKAQDETASALMYLLRKGSISFGSNRDFSTCFRALSIESALTAGELLHLASFLENVDRVRRYRVFEKDAPEEDALRDVFDALYPVPDLLREIRHCILSEEEIADDASPELKRIRKNMQQTQDRIHTQLTKMVSSSYASYLQDAVITIRGNRYCIPVRAEHKAQVPGLILDQSSSGSTLFIEPAAIVEMDNTLRTLDNEEKKEIDRILAGISSLAAAHLSELKSDASAMTALDFAFAKASLALEQGAMRPVFNDEHIIDLKQARHPLIEKDKVVPIDVVLGIDYDMLVVTGPNTGGKTVSLKTTGLLTLMGMSGLHIPAGDGSRLSIFREIFADIGDEQSIEQSLSTFSAHMTSIVDIFKRVDRNCLCLFDELGAGTDPTEGAALAISILNFLHTRKITTMATTHYSELKVYAMQTEGVENASCEFNVETLRPTYRLLTGIPGKSNAFAISKRLGLPGYIIETAKEQLSQETQNFEDILTDLEIARRELEQKQQELDRERAAFDKEKQQLKEREKQLEKKRDDIIRRANEDARDILAGAKETADNAISAMRRSGKGADLSDMERIRTGLREKVSEKDSKLAFSSGRNNTAKRSSAPDEIKPGDSVRVISMGLTGIVQTKPDKDGNLFVQCGIMQTKCRLSDLEPVDDTSIAGSAPQKSSSGSSLKKAFQKGASEGHMDLSRSAGISAELNLLGMTTDEAIMELDKYLDNARLSHLSSVRIVHGKGTGALRNAVQNYLRRQKWIVSYRAGDFGEGDAGVTIVTLKK